MTALGPHRPTAAPSAFSGAGRALPAREAEAPQFGRRETLALLGAALLAPEEVAAEPIASDDWRQLATEPYKGKQDDIAFVSPDIGWYGNGAGKLYATRDGGNTWRKIWEKPGTFIRALGFVDERLGFLGNVGTDYYPGVTDTHPLYITRDGGEMWEPVDAPGMAAVSGICGIDVLRDRRVFQGEARSVPIINAAGRVGGPAAVITSRDSGQSWSITDLSGQAGMILDVKFTDARTGFLCAASNSDLENAHALILRTTDGGGSWHPVYQGNRMFENVWKMSWPSQRVGYATVQSYDPSPQNTRRIVLKTENGGRSWRELSLVDGPAVQEFGIGFLDERRGWVGCVARGYATSDGGRSWRPSTLGRAVNKIRLVRDDTRVRMFAIGINVHRLDIA